MIGDSAMNHDCTIVQFAAALLIENIMQTRWKWKREKMTAFEFTRVHSREFTHERYE